MTPETSDICLTLPARPRCGPRFRVEGRLPPYLRGQRNNVRIVVEKIGHKVDPVKVYPLAGPCQLVHCHYNCTVYYDEISWSDYPIPFNHVDHKVEVVYIDKDHLRRARPTQAAGDPVDDRIDRLSREIEQLKQTRRATVASRSRSSTA